MRNFEGMLKILRFNWPLYVMASVVLALSFSTQSLLPVEWGTMAVLCIACVAFWMVSSLGVSHWIYDLSELSNGRAVFRLLPKTPEQWVTLHAGFDDFTTKLRNQYPMSHGFAIDLYDPGLMTEGSIRRARSEPTGFLTVRAEHSRLPLRNRSVDAVFLVFAAHEFRNANSRSELFCEIQRILSAQGHLVLVEHGRDITNFLAFGPGFLHFQPVRRWLRLAVGSGLLFQKRSRVTPFVHLFLFRNKGGETGCSVN